MFSNTGDWEEARRNTARFNRRRFLALAGIATGGIGGGGYLSHWILRDRQPPANVVIRKSSSYRESFAGLIRETLLQYPDVVARARAGTVVLKPNLVEYHRGRPVNTNPAVVAGAIEAFKSVGAKSVVIAEGSGHCRDTELLIDESGLGDVIADERVKFVDLNLDSVRLVSLPANRTKLDRMFFPETILSAGLVVSMAKLKTHHWAGVTLSLKNMFGTAPGARYGWPKNLLHWRGIDNSIVDINTALKPGFAIIDGVEGMEGDGPLRGDGVQSGVLIMGNNPTAVDATATRVMGLYPEKVRYLDMMSRFGGTLHESRIQQRGELIVDVKRSFRVIDAFSGLGETSPLFELYRRL